MSRAKTVAFLRFLAQVERLKAAGVITDYGTGPGEYELWVGVSEAIVAQLGKHGPQLLDPGWWQHAAEGAGVGFLRITFRRLGPDEAPERSPDAVTWMPVSSFLDVRAGDVVCRMLAGRIPMLLTVSAVDEELIHAGADGAGWSFDRATGVEVDEDLGWGPTFGISGSYLKRESEA